MNSIYSDNTGKLLLRWTIGFLMLFHGYAKVKHGVSFIEQLLIAKNYPAFLAYGAYIGEVLAPVLLIIGYKTRLAAFAIIANMIAAIYLVHSTDITLLTKHGGLVLELQYFYIMAAAVVLVFGAGRYSIDND